MTDATCHYCGDDFDADDVADVLQSWAEAEGHPICGSCGFDVVANGAELSPLPEFQEMKVVTHESGNPR